MTTDLQRVMHWYNIDPLRYTYLLDFWKRGAEIVCDRENGFALYNTKYNMLYTAGEEPECPELYSATLRLVETEALKDRLMATGKYEGWTACISAYYFGKPLPLPYCDCRIRKLDYGDIQFVLEHYDNPGSYEAHIRTRIADGMLGAEVNGKLAGFIGTHMEGAVGLLMVLPEYRRRGIAERLEAEMINLVLSKGFTPYCHIKEDNTVSMALQKKLGFTFEKKLIYWVG